jgi:hypothetical protein
MKIRMHYFFTLLACSIALSGWTQPFWGIGPFQDLQGYFKAFHNGVIRQLEYLPVKNYKIGDNILAFIDNKGDVKVFTGDKVITLAGIANNYEVSDNILVFNQGPITSLWTNGQGTKLTNFGRKYIVKDSLVVFEDTQFNAVKVWYNHEVKDLYMAVGNLYLPDAIGDNIVAFRGVGNTYYVFHRGRFYELETFSSDVKFSCGRDIAAFNDPLNMSFAIFENGQFLDLDPMHAKEFKTGFSCVTYLDQNRNLHYYSKGNLKTLSNYSPDYWDANDQMVLWGEGDLFQVWDGKQVVTAGYFRPNRWVIKNNVVAFFNQMGGVDCVIDGKVINITNEPVVDFYINGQMVVVELPNSSFLAYTGGKKVRSL